MAAQRIVTGWLVQRRNALNRRMKERKLRGKHIAQEPGNAQRYVNPRAVQLHQRDDLETRHPERAVIPNGLHAQKRERGADLFAARAHRLAAPKIEHHAARPIAVIFDIAGDDGIRHARAVLAGERRRNACADRRCRDCGRWAGRQRGPGWARRRAAAR